MDRRTALGPERVFTGYVADEPDVVDARHVVFIVLVDDRDDPRPTRFTVHAFDDTVAGLLPQAVRDSRIVFIGRPALDTPPAEDPEIRLLHVTPF